MMSPWAARTCKAALAAVLFAALCTPAPAAEPANRSSPVRIGMIESLFRDMPEAMVLTLMQPFAALMETQTGVTGHLVPAGGAHSLGGELATDKVQLGVFHGIEFAWARQKHPDLRPLMIAVNQERHLRAVLVVRADSKATSVNDLRERSVTIPKGAREHCHLFLHQRCQQQGQDIRTFFSKLAISPNSEEGLEDVIDGNVDAAIVDTLSLETFKKVKPGRASRLKVIQHSEVFPAAVIAYRPGSVNEETLERFRSGMINANKNTTGRRLLMLWKLTGFEPVPEDYERTLAEILKVYPDPITLTH